MGEDGQFEPRVFRKNKTSGHTYQEPLLSRVLDELRLRTFQLVTVAGSGVIAKTVVAPLERVKILMQVTSRHTLPCVHSRPKLPVTSGIACLRHLIRYEPWHALFRGHGANMLRLAPDMMLKFGIHDQLRIICGAADPSQSTWNGKLAASSLTGLIRTALFHPLSVVRTRLTADLASPRAYPGIFACVRDTWRQERFAGFYRGAGPAALATVPHLTVCFGAYDVMVEQLPKDKRSIHQLWYPWAKMGCAAGATLLASAATYPLDTVRRRMEANGSLGSHSSRYAGMLDCMSKLYSSAGIRGFYRGVVINSVKIVPSTALQFIAYDSLKSVMMLVDPATAATARM